MQNPNSPNNTIKDRQPVYGDFTTQAGIVQVLKTFMRDTLGWEELSSDKKEALEMIATKIGRVLNGDANHKDSWHDIAGYAMLAEERCK